MNRIVYHFCAFTITSEGIAFKDGIISTSEPINPQNQLYTSIRESIANDFQVTPESITILTLTPLPQ